MSIKNPAAQIIDTINRVYKNGLTTTSGGNLSIKDSEGNIYITPSGKDKGTLVPEDVVKVLPNGERIGAFKPSIELPFHSLIYKLRPEIGAVLHVHSPFLVSYSLLNSSPDIKIMPNLFVSSGNVGLSLYDIPGSIDLGRQIAKYIEQGYDSVMMQNHGVVVIAEDMATCYKKLESLEGCAEICLKANMLGLPAKSLSDAEIKLYTDRKPCENFENISISADEMKIRENMVAFSTRCYRHKLFSVNSGVISVKLSDDAFLITPEAYDRENLAPEQIVKIESGKQLGGKASVEAELHSLIYKEKPDVKSIFQACSPNIMAYGVTGKEISSRTIPESYIMMRDLTRLPYASNITDKKGVVNALTPSTPVTLIANTCVLTTGESITKAFDRLEVSDVTAKNLILTTVLGKPCDITDYEIEKIDVAFNLPK